jgi:V/A-type H+-transporting ATPase subunit F
VISMDRVAVIGDRASVLAFRAMGVDVFTPTDSDAARNNVDRAAREGYGVIFLTETVAAMIPETVARYRSQLKPAVILIPDHQGSMGIGMNDIYKNVEKAVGTNIFK